MAEEIVGEAGNILTVYDYSDELKEFLANNWDYGTTPESTEAIINTNPTYSNNKYK